MGKSTSHSLDGHPAVDVGHRLLLSSHLSKSISFQQASVLKLLVAGLQSMSVMLQGLQGPKILGDLQPQPSSNGFGSRLKTTNVHACFQSQKIRKTYPKAFKMKKTFPCPS